MNWSGLGRRESDGVRVITGDDLEFERSYQGKGPTCCGAPMQYAGDGIWECDDCETTQR
jgi:ribosomal protein L37AE/L43A